MKTETDLNMTPSITLTEFYDGLLKHDWHYMYSDDSDVRTRGWNQIKFLIAAAIISEEHLAMFNGVKAHYSSGIGFGTDQLPLPERPES